MEINYTCKRCQDGQYLNRKEEYNLTKNQKLYESINDDSLFTHTCTTCGEKNIVLHECLFIDDDYKFLIKLDTANDKVLIKPKEYEFYKVRIVTSLNELKEKMRIYYQFLDDVVVEIIKKILSEHLKNEKINFDYITFHRFVNNKLSFVILNGDNVSNVLYDIEGYNKIYYKLKNNDRFNSIQYVNEKTIEEFIKELDK